MDDNFSATILVIDKRKNPNWTRGEEAIRNTSTYFLKEYLSDAGFELEDFDIEEDSDMIHEELIQIFLDAMNECRAAIEGDCSSIDHSVVKDMIVYITGGNGWNVSRTQKAFSIFSSSPGYEAAEFGD